jgi:hypothetical protein
MTQLSKCCGAEINENYSYHPYWSKCSKCGKDVGMDTMPSEPSESLEERVDLVHLLEERHPQLRGIRGRLTDDKPFLLPPSCPYCDGHWDGLRNDLANREKYIEKQLTKRERLAELRALEMFEKDMRGWSFQEMLDDENDHRDIETIVRGCLNLSKHHVKAELQRLEEHE